jgi:carboxyl-terminal processing protease
MLAPLRSGRLRRLLVLPALIALLVAGIWLGGHPRHLPGFIADHIAGGRQARAFDQALHLIQTDYYRAVKKGSLVDDSITGMVSKLHDQFSAYIPPRDYRAFENVTNGEFSGVGMQVLGDPRGLRVVEVYDGSPAKRAGIRPGDVVTGVDGRSLAGRSEDVATAMIKGPAGTDVVLTFRHGRTVLRKRLTRATVSIPIVASGFHRVGGVRLAQVALAQFTPGAHGEVRAAVDRVLRRGARGIVFDLRHDGGGLLEEARLVASVFIPDGKIVTTRGRHEPERTLYATGNAISPTIPVVVLVDRLTASASEIVTGALQDRGRATVVGTRTYGKGVFQEVDRLPNGGALKLTVGEYFTPSGRNLGGGGVRRGGGITPDIEARDNPKTPPDEALAVALRTLARKVKQA